MTNVLVVLLGLVMASYLVSMVHRHRRGLVAERGMSIGADLGSLADQARVRVRAVVPVSADRVRLVLTPEGDAHGLELELVVLLGQDEFGFHLLRDWQRAESSVAIVIPPGSRIVRLRSIDDLQPLTLRRADTD